MHKNSTRTSPFLTLILVLFLSCSAAGISAQVHVFTFAGTGSPGFMNGDTSVASFDTPHGLAIDQAGNVYVADGGNHVIRKLATDGTVSTYAGSGTAGFQDGPAAQARFNDPYNICSDPAGNIYVSDFLNHRIRKIDTGGMVTTLAGSGVAGYMDGVDSVAQFNYPRGICIDAAGNLYIGDSWNHRIRKVTPTGTVSTWAGGGANIGVQSIGAYADGLDTMARFWTPTEVSIDTLGNLYVADAFNHRIRKINVNRNVTTVAGSGTPGPTNGGYQNGPGALARFDTPTAVYASLDGNLYLGDGGTHRLRKIDTTNFVSSFAGFGAMGFVDGPDSLARFDFPRAILIDYARNRMYVVDTRNHAIRYLTLGTTIGLPTPLSAQIEVYPNPFSDHISIAARGYTGRLHIDVLNAMGQKLHTYTGDATTQLKLPELAPGVYFVRVQKNDGTRFVQKLVKSQE